MDGWKLVCILLCAFGFFKSFRPSEPFLTQYLMGPWVNLTAEEINSQVYPVATYSYLAVLVIVLLITDFLRYKPIILLEASSLIGTYVLLIWGRTLQTTLIVEFLYAVATSCEVAYYTYIYAKVAGDHYQKVTGYTRAAVLAGFFLSGVIGQILISLDILNFYDLNFITLAAMCLSLVLALLLPKVDRSIYFHQETVKSSKENVSESSVSQNNNHTSYQDDNGEMPARLVPANENMFCVKIKNGFKSILQDLKYSYGQTSVIKWSLWWACGTCLNLQVRNYIQPLWEEIYPSSINTIYNGAVESTHTLLGAAVAVGVGFVHIDWSVYGELVLTVVSLLDAACLFIMAQTYIIWVAYVTYGIFCIAYQMMITIASYQVAKDLREDTHGLVFGCNTFLALILQTILVFIVVDEHGLAALSRLQFMIYASCALVLGLAFLVTGIIVFFKRRRTFRL